MNTLEQHEIGRYIASRYRLSRAASRQSKPLQSSPETMSHSLPSPRPANEIENPICVSCSELIEDNAYFDDFEESYFCEFCMEESIATYETEAKAYAEAEFKITHPLPEYNADDECRCSPEEYERGEKYSVSPNAYLASCRHNCSNYDELIADLSRDGVRDRIFQCEIQSKINSLLKELISREQPDAVDLSWEGD